MTDNTASKVVKVRCHSCEQKLDLSEMTPFAKVLCPNCETSLIVPRWFGDYLLEELAGEGGMAKVYRALELTLEREVAIKILSAEFLDKPTLVDRFLDEGRAAASVNNPNVVPIYSCGNVQGETYLVMQYMSGGSLDDRISRESPMDVMECIRCLIQAAQGLEAAHRSGIVHHDVKPANLLFDSENMLKVGDFGLAQIKWKQDRRSDNDLGRWLTPYYVSPEKAATGREDIRGDIYSLGATAYHMLTGEPPFSGSDVESIIHARLHQSPPEPRNIRADIPAPVNDLIVKMLAPVPDQRPPSYAELLTQLRALVVVNNSNTVRLRTMRQRSDGKHSGKIMISRGSSGETAPANDGQRLTFGKKPGSIRSAITPPENLNRSGSLGFVISNADAAGVDQRLQRMLYRQKERAQFNKLVLLALLAAALIAVMLAKWNELGPWAAPPL